MVTLNADLDVPIYGNRVIIIRSLCDVEKIFDLLLNCEVAWLALHLITKLNVDLIICIKNFIYQGIIKKMYKTKLL